MTNWQGSTRRARLPRDWPARVAATRERAQGRCQATAHVDDCNGIGTDCDHITRGDDHSLTNLQWLSGPCHKAKTQAEQPSPKRPPEAHPGRLT